MKKPPQHRKKSGHTKTATPDDDKTPVGGRALQRIRQQNRARGLDQPEIASLNLARETTKRNAPVRDANIRVDATKPTPRKKRSVQEKQKPSARKSPTKNSTTANQKKRK